MPFLFKDSIQGTKAFFGQFDSFEYISVQLKSPCRSLFVTIYKQPKYISKFSDEFAQLMSIVCIDYDYVLLVGDFNIHVNNLKDRCAPEFMSTIDDFGLSQHVTHSMHNKGHKLDLVISKGVVSLRLW